MARARTINGLQLQWILLPAAPFVGSFLGVVIKRLPAGRSIVAPRSHCPRCRTPLGIGELVPLLSWLAQRGRCRHCGQAVGAFYPLIELAALAVALWAYWAAPPGQVILTTLVGWLLLSLAVIDQRDGILPNSLVAWLFGLGLIPVAAMAAGDRLDHLLGAVAGFAFLALLGLAYKRVRGVEGLGWGDAKFMGAAGLLVGWQAVPSVILVASVAALAVAAWRTRREGGPKAMTRLAFGPYLCAATWLVQFYGPIGF